jgi:hypothetical protein
MVNEEKVRDLGAEELQRINKNGMLPLIMAHLFSMAVMRDVFGKQLQQGKGPQVPAPAPAFGNA